MTDPDRADTEQDVLEAGLATIRQEERTQARDESRRDFWRRYWPRMIAAVTLVSLIVAGGVAYAVQGLQQRADASDAAISALAQQAAASKEQGERANEALRARGQAPVSIPDPGTADDTEVITAAATARVLASLPAYVTTGQLGGAIAQYVAANPPSPAQPTPGQLSAALAGYYTTNPVPAGPAGPSGRPGANGQPGQTVQGPQGQQGIRGERGEPAPPPTAEQLQTAVGQYLREHPEALCPQGGSFAQIRVVLADGGAADTWSCVVTTYPAPTQQPTGLLPLPGG